MFVKDILKREFLHFVPFQDKAIVMELVVNALRNSKEVRSVSYIMNSPIVSKTSSFKNEELNKKVEEYFKVSYNPVCLYEFEEVNSNLSKVVMPFYSLNSLHCILIVQFFTEKSLEELITELTSISYYVSILLDRIDYALELQKKNDSLINLNSKLSKDLDLAIIDFNQQAELARQASMKFSNKDISKELIHEINNPLSLIQFDICELQELSKQVEFNEDLYIDLAQIYSVSVEEVKLYFNQNNKDLNSKYLKIHEELKKYPLIVSLISFQNILTKLQVLTKNSVHNIENVVSLLDLLRSSGVLNSTDLEVLDTAEVIEDVMKLFQNKFSKLDVKTNVSGKRNRYFIMADRLRLYQVLINIVLNSMKAMVDISEKSLSIKLFEESTYVKISVEDSGAGFDLSKLQYNIADSTKKSRVGLGLLICKNIVAQLNGKMIFSKNVKSMNVDILLPKHKNSKKED